MCPEVDSASKNEYQINPGGKDDRCVRLTTNHLNVPMSRNLGVLTSCNPVGLFRPVMGQQTAMCFEDNIPLNSSLNEKCFRQNLQRKSKHTICVQYFFSRKSAVYDVMLENTV
jgi:hypothetical protein